METNIVQIPWAEVSFHPQSFRDPTGRLFWWRGGLYRGVTQEKVDFVQRLFHDGVVEKLINEGLLVHSELTNLALEGYGLVLKHAEVPFVSCNYEWCAAMLKDAALLIAHLELELMRHGLTLRDAYPNVLFSGTRPVYVDFNSICPDAAQQFWEAHDQLCRFYFHPLLLMVHGYERVARWLLHDPYEGVRRNEFETIIRNRSIRSAIRTGISTLKTAIGKLISVATDNLPSRLRAPLKSGAGTLKAALQRPDIIGRLDRMHRLKRELLGVTIPVSQSEWSEYYDDCYPLFSPTEEWTPKHHSIYNVLSELRPASVLDIGCNRGWYSQLAASLGSDVVACDWDQTCITQLYLDAKGKNLQILPLVMDFRLPSPGHGLDDMEGTPATQRLKCELVLALAIVHHLVAKYCISFERITQGLATFSTRWLLVEFVPDEDEIFHQPWSFKCPWYTLENFVLALKQHFHTVEMHSSHPEPRILLLCEK